ncbi:MAG: hypothetical protein Q9174_002415 [Haloplaca sp. 1 TL-2023]
MHGHFDSGISARNSHYYGSTKRDVRINNPRPLAQDRKSISQTSQPCPLQFCPLLALMPWEIRMQIWRCIVGDNIFDIRLSPGRLTSGIVSTDDVGYAHFSRELHDDKWLGGLLQPERLDIIPLLQTCHQVYNEAIDIVYASNTFDIPDVGTLMYFVRGVPDESLVLIRSLSVHVPELFGPSWKVGSRSYWPGSYSMFWRSVAANLTGLRTVYHHGSGNCDQYPVQGLQQIYYHGVKSSVEFTAKGLEDCLSDATGWVVGEDFSVEDEEAHVEVQHGNLELKMVFTIVVGPSKTLFYVHGDVLAKSKVLAKEVGGSWKENQESRIEWPDWNVDAVSVFVEWLYCRDYTCPYPSKIADTSVAPEPAAEDYPTEEDRDPAATGSYGRNGDQPILDSRLVAVDMCQDDEYIPKKKKKKGRSIWEDDEVSPKISWSPKPLSDLTWAGCRDLAHMTQSEEFDKWSGHLIWKPQELDYGATFMTHAQLYVMACFYMLPDLKNMAWQRLRSVLTTIGSPAKDWKVIENLGELVHYTYAETESSDQEPLRMLVTAFTALHFPRIKGQVIDQLILSEARSDKEFVVDLMSDLTQQLGELKALAGKS